MANGIGVLNGPEELHYKRQKPQIWALISVLGLSVQMFLV